MNESISSRHARRNNVGVVLIVIGVLILLAQFNENALVGLLFMPALGGIFLLWGLLNRSFGLLIPGGILLGIGFGTILVDGNLLPLNGIDEGAVFLLAFASGWVLITLLSPFTDAGWRLWPLIPGGIMAVIGLLLLAGSWGQRVLALSDYAWPLALILLGVYFLLRQPDA